MFPLGSTLGARRDIAPFYSALVRVSSAEGPDEFFQVSNASKCTRGVRKRMRDLTYQYVIFTETECATLRPFSLFNLLTFARDAEKLEKELFQKAKNQRN